MLSNVLPGAMMGEIAKSGLTSDKVSAKSGLTSDKVSFKSGLTSDKV